MSMSKVVQEALNQQVNNELTASHEYLAMAAWCEQQAFRGAATWLRLQSQEEHGHGMKLFNFLLARGGDAKLGAMAAPTGTFRSLLEVFETVLKQEQKVTGQIDALYELAFKEKAFAALVELQWFIAEQVEEEQSARDIVTKLKMVGDDPASILTIDAELSSRSAAA